MNRRWGERRFIKLGTQSGQVADVRFAADAYEFSVGARVEYRFGRGYGDKWQSARIWAIGPAPEHRLFLEL